MVVMALEVNMILIHDLSKATKLVEAMNLQGAKVILESNTDSHFHLRSKDNNTLRMIYKIINFCVKRNWEIDRIQTKHINNYC